MLGRAFAPLHNVINDGRHDSPNRSPALIFYKYERDRVTCFSKAPWSEWQHDQKLPLAIITLVHYYYWQANQGEKGTSWRAFPRLLSSVLSSTL